MGEVSGGWGGAGSQAYLVGAARALSLTLAISLTLFRTQFIPGPITREGTGVCPLDGGFVISTPDIGCTGGRWATYPCGSLLAGTIKLTCGSQGENRRNRDPRCGDWVGLQVTPLGKRDGCAVYGRRLKCGSDLQGVCDWNIVMALQDTGRGYPSLLSSWLAFGWLSHKNYPCAILPLCLPWIPERAHIEGAGVTGWSLDDHMTRSPIVLL